MFPKLLLVLPKKMNKERGLDVNHPGLWPPLLKKTKEGSFFAFN
jgi:hypothetical protein